MGENKVTDIYFMTCAIFVCMLYYHDPTVSSFISPGTTSGSHLIPQLLQIIFTLLYLHHFQALHWQKGDRWCHSLAHVWCALPQCWYHTACHSHSTLFSSIASLLVTSVFNSLMRKALREERTSWEWHVAHVTLIHRSYVEAEWRNQWQIALLGFNLTPRFAAQITTDVNPVTGFCVRNALRWGGGQALAIT